jgi:hypothetical protein
MKITANRMTIEKKIVSSIFFAPFSCGGPLAKARRESAEVFACKANCLLPVG